MEQSKKKVSELIFFCYYALYLLSLQMFLPQALFTAPLHEVCPLTPEEADIPRQIISSYSKGNSKKHWQNYYFCLSKRSLLLNPSNLVNKNMGECQLRKKKSSRERGNTSQKYIVEFTQSLNTHTMSPLLKMFCLFSSWLIGEIQPQH